MSRNYGVDVDLTERLFGIKCPHCNKRTDMRRRHYVRGYNEMCEQALGDDGFYCMDCTGITWRISYEDTCRIFPKWCTVSPDSARAKFFPDFKHNLDMTNAETHASHKYDSDLKKIA